MTDDRGVMCKLSHQESILCGILHARYSNNVIERLVLSMKTPSWRGIRSVRPKVDSPEAFSPWNDDDSPDVSTWYKKTWIARKQALDTELRPCFYGKKLSRERRSPLASVYMRIKMTPLPETTARKHGLSSRVRRLGASLGSFTINDGNGSENASFKMNSTFYTLCRIYFNLLKMASVGEFPWS